MPIESLKTSSRLFARRLRKGLAGHLGWTANRPFGRLVRHFLARMTRAGQESASTEFELGVGGLLGLLAVPGAFATLLLLPKYSSFLRMLRGMPLGDPYVESIPDKYFFIVLSMTITGVVTVLKWDKILPDQQDYLNLAPLPVTTRTIFLANATAILFAVAVFTLDVNAISSLLFPAIIATELNNSAVFLRFAGPQALCVILAGAFTFCGVSAVMGGIETVLPRRVARACAPWVRGALLVGFVLVLLTIFSGTALARRIGHDPDSLVRLLPPMWFLGLYQKLQPGVGTRLSELGEAGLVGVAVTFVLAAALYALSYRRSFMGVPEGTGRPARRSLPALGLRWFDLFSFGGDRFQRACHRFAIRALLRNDAHRVCLAASIGLAWLFAALSASTALTATGASGGRLIHAGLLAPPLAGAYLLILGLRFSFGVPAGLGANWIFRVILDRNENNLAGVARRVMLSFLTPLVLLPGFALYSALWDPGIAVVHVMYVLALSGCLIEFLLDGYRKIPLTCSLPPLRNQILLPLVLYGSGFLVFTWVGAAVETWMFRQPLRFLLVPAAMAAVWLWNRRRNETAEDRDLSLTFEDLPPPALETLHLLDNT